MYLVVMVLDVVIEVPLATIVGSDGVDAGEETKDRSDHRVLYERW
jgi:hypothetical protein